MLQNLMNLIRCLKNILWLEACWSEEGISLVFVVLAFFNWSECVFHFHWWLSLNFIKKFFKARSIVSNLWQLFLFLSEKLVSWDYFLNFLHLFLNIHIFLLLKVIVINACISNWLLHSSVSIKIKDLQNIWNCVISILVRKNNPACSIFLRLIKEIWWNCKSYWLLWLIVWINTAVVHPFFL
jgi:hypothetical protein